MTLKFAFIMDPMSTVVVGHDTSFALMLEAAARGHEIYHGLIAGLGVETRGGASRATAVLSKLAVRAKKGDPADVLETKQAYLDGFDVVLMRKDPPFDMTYVMATYCLDAIAQPGGRTLVINRPESLRRANEKMFIHGFADLVPDTLVTCRKEDIRAFCEAHGGQAIMKPLDRMGGLGIFKLKLDDANFNALVETATDNGKTWQMVQQVLDISKGDKRIMLLDGEPLGGVARYAAANENRANMARGGSARFEPLTARELDICAALAPVLKAEGLYLTGIDVIDGFLTEINVTSPTGIVEIDQLGGLNTAARVIDWVEAKTA